jgi:hypothetical protein
MESEASSTPSLSAMIIRSFCLFVFVGADPCVCPELNYPIIIKKIELLLSFNGKILT